MSDPTPASAEEKAARSVERGGWLVLFLLLASFVLYLLGDRLTPYTSQARLQAFVVGVAPKVSGVITQVWVKNNQRVKAGDRLFQVDPSQYRIALAKARARLADARSQLASADAAVEAARSSLDSALAHEEKTRKDAERQQRLYRQDPGAISVRRVEVAEAAYKEAVAAVARARANLEKARKQREGALERLKAAKAMVEMAKLDLDNTLVTAESDGTITDLQTAVGRYARQGQAVMTLVARHDLWIEARYTENNLGHLAPGTPVEFVLDSLPGRVFQGEVVSIGLGVSEGDSPQPGNLPTIRNSRDWLRPAQRFPVMIRFDAGQKGMVSRQLRVGGQADVIAYSDGAGLLEPLGRLYIRLASWLSYLY
jgi:multidrug resistance efflux pump